MEKVGSFCFMVCHYCHCLYIAYMCVYRYDSLLTTIYIGSASIITTTLDANSEYRYAIHIADIIIKQCGIGLNIFAKYVVHLHLGLYHVSFYEIERISCLVVSCGTTYKCI